MLDPKNADGHSGIRLRTVTPHVDTPVRGGMGQIMATPKKGDRLIFRLFGRARLACSTPQIARTCNRFPARIVSFGKERRAA